MKDNNQSDHSPAGDAAKPLLQFPVKYELKVIFDATLEQTVHQRNLELVLEDATVVFSDIRFKPSRQGNYVSISVNVTLNTEAQMQFLYQRLRLLPGLKTAI